MTQFSVVEKLAVIREKSAPRDGLLKRLRLALRPVTLVVLGLKDNVLFFPLANASRARSYHFQSDGPEDAYLFAQQVNGAPGDLRYRFRSIGGQAFSHLYVRSAPAMANPYYQGRYYDVPPGAIGIALVAAFSSLFAMIILAIQHLNWLSGEPLGGVGASLLLGLPGIVVAYIGIGRTGGFLTGSVSARIVSLISLALSLLTIAVVGAFPRASLYSADLLNTDIAVFSKAFALWLSVLSAQALTLMFALGVWAYRSWVYFSLTREVKGPRRTEDDHVG